jgi:hypothetical protein
VRTNQQSNGQLRIYLHMLSVLSQSQAWKCWIT